MDTQKIDPVEKILDEYIQIKEHGDDDYEILIVDRPQGKGSLEISLYRGDQFKVNFYDIVLRQVLGKMFQGWWMRDLTARPSWDEYFMSIAVLAASRATCNRKKVGSIIVKDNRIISTGYNGAPPTEPHCTEVGCNIDETGSCTRTEHSEKNAMLWVDGMSCKGGTLYTTYSPCLICSELIATCGILELVYLEKYWKTVGLDYLENSGVNHRQFKGYLISLGSYL